MEYNFRGVKEVKVLLSQTWFLVVAINLNEMIKDVVRA